MFIPFWSAFRLRQEMRKRASLSDDDFVGQIGSSSDDRRFIIAVRRAIARCCKISPEILYPKDGFYDLAENLMYMGLGWDELEFIFALEEEVALKIRRTAIVFPRDDRYAFWRRRVAPGIRVGDWVSQVVPQLKEAMRSQAS